MHHVLMAFIQDESGVSTVEYALLMALVVIASVGAWSQLVERVRAAVAAVEAGLTE